MRSMAHPRVIGESRRSPSTRSPPADPTPPEWASESALRLFEDATADGRPLPLYISSTVDRRIREQAAEAAPSRLEVMGLLLGEVWEWRSSRYTVVRAVATTDLKNSPAKVKFDPDALPKLFLQLDGAGFDYVVVGWYHSHPGHTCFLSRTDLDTQKSFFNEPYHSAVVIDPVTMEISAFRLEGDGYVEVPFGIIRDTQARSRRLKVHS